MGVRWIALPTASILILLFDGMSKRHNYNWNSYSCSYAVWNAPMLCGMHKLMHHLVLQIRDHDWHPIGDTKSIKVEVKVCGNWSRRVHYSLVGAVEDESYRNYNFFCKSTNGIC